MLSVRVQDGLLDWLEAYAAERKVPKTALVTAALEAFRADCETGVPDAKPKPKPKRVVVVKPEPEPQSWKEIMAARQVRVNKLGR